MDSSPTAARSPAEVRSPAFPPELVALILTHALPSASTANFGARAAILLPVSLLSRSWRDYAQAQLFERAVLRTDVRGRGGVSNAAELLLRTVQSSARCKGLIKSLYIGRTLEGPGDRSRWRAQGVRELLEELAAVRELGLESLFQLNLSWLNKLTQLERLSLHNVEGRISDPIVLPALTSLSLSHCELWEEDWHTLISPSSLPSLRALGIFGNPRLSALLAPLPPAFVHQLDGMFTNPLAERNWRGATSSGTLIRAPVLWECLSHYGLQQLFIEERDVPIRHLRCRGWRADQLAVLADLLALNVNGVDRENVTRAVEGLRTLYLDEEEAYPLQAREMARRVIEACKSAKVEVVREGDGDQKSSLVSAEFWSRARENSGGGGGGPTEGEEGERSGRVVWG